MSLESAIARVLKEGREKLNLSIDDLAALSKIAPARIAALESGGETLYVNELKLLAHGFGIPSLAFIGTLYAMAEGKAAP